MHKCYYHDLLLNDFQHTEHENETKNRERRRRLLLSLWRCLHQITGCKYHFCFIYFLRIFFYCIYFWVLIFPSSFVSIDEEAFLVKGNTWPFIATLFFCSSQDALKWNTTVNVNGMLWCRIPWEVTFYISHIFIDLMIWCLDSAVCLMQRTIAYEMLKGDKKWSYRTR